MDLVLTYIQGVLETLGLIFLALVIARVKIKWRNTIIAAIVITAVVLAIRNMPVVFGMHLPVSILMIFIFITTMTDAPKSLVFMSVFVGFLCLATIEYSLNQLFISLGLLHLEDVAETSSVWMMIGYIQAVLMNILAVLLQLTLKPQNSWKTKISD